MSRLEQLIADLCPDGVEYLKLKKVAQISAGGDLPENYVKGQQSPSEDHPYPIYSNGTEDGALYGFTDGYKIEKEAVTLSARGTIGYHKVRAGKFTPIVRLITLIADESKISTNYLNYVLCIAGIEGVNTGIPSLTVPMLENVRIPLPPIPVQKEIVRILDTFTALEAELEAELEARTKQYEYYRDALLNFDPESLQSHSLRPARPTRLNHLIQTLCPNGVELSKIQDVCLPSDTIEWKKNSEESFEYIDLSSVDRDTHSILATSSINFSTAPSRAQRIVKFGDVIIGTTRPTLKRYCIIPEEYDNQICSTGFCVLRANKDRILPRFLFFQISKRDFWEYTELHQRGAAYPSISDGDVKDFEIPIPPLPVQEEIVAILDRFEALVGDLKSGLPAEIALRRKQYETYRDKLLTFQPLP